VFAQSFARAQEEGSIIQAESLRTIAETTPDPNRARIIVDAVKWRLERQFRKHWSASIDVNVNERIDINGALIDARKRVLLPNSNLAQLVNAQDTEYTLIPAMSAADNESADVVSTLPAGTPNPFD
jgi:hypothetical protein